MILAIETSCDETSASVVDAGRVLSNVVSSQVAVHLEYGGVVPELATREHLRNLGPVVAAALQQAGVRVEALDAIAATRGPGLPSALLVGFQAAQAMAFALDRPFYGIHHHEAHLYSAWIAGSPPVADFTEWLPVVCLIVSGGHTLLVSIPQEGNHRVLGSTIDDAAGECFDKVAKLLGLGYPGGPALERWAEGGDPKAYSFPRPMLNDPGDDFSFSGLKTSVRYFIRDHPELVSREGLPDLCASVQAAIVDVLVTKTVRAAVRVGAQVVAASGGVACNRRLRRRLEEACQRQGLQLRVAAPAFCTDNAGMVGVVAERIRQRGVPALPFDTEIDPAWEL